MNIPFPYRLDTPDATLDLPFALREVSGLSASPNGLELLALNDEDATIFYLDAQTGAVLRTRSFGAGGDYEGIEAVGTDIFVVKSNGTLYRIPESGETETIPTALDAGFDVEGLGYDAKTHRLLLACKGKAGKGDAFRHKKAVYAFDLAAKRLHETPALLLHRDTITQLKRTPGGFWAKLIEFFTSDNSASEFGPSGIAQCPTDGTFYIIASAGKTLAVVQASGQLVHVQRLNPGIFRQPEGICFNKNGDLFIATEGGKGKGRILRFAPRVVSGQ